MNDCGNCRASTPKRQRQFMGCGYEAKDPAINASPWDHEGRVLTKAPSPTTCPGYTVKLPIVTEIYRLRLHWSKGALASVLDDGERLTDQAREGIEILDRAFNELEAWRVRSKEKGGPS